MNPIVYFILTVLGGPFGLHKFATGKKAMGIVYLCTFGLFGIGWIYDIVIAAIQLGKTSSPSKVDAKIDVVGEYYRHNEICSVMSGNRLYSLADNEFIKAVSPEKRIYRYKYRETAAQLVPEPTNPHDPNAIKVMVDNVHVGYVPAEYCSDIKRNLKKLTEITAHIHGGDYKYHANDEVYKAQESFIIELYITR